jgi:flavin-dependent dehydrogenase
MGNRSVVIVGGGPAGAATAAFLARAGTSVVLFDAGKRPELVVGESLVPSCIPILRRLGIEEEVRAYSEVKPGASFAFRDTEDTVTHFSDFSHVPADYAYNAPRERFDETLLRNAEAAGVRVIRERASFVQRGARAIGLDKESAERCHKFFNPEEAFLVDATGRRRLSCAVLGIGEKTGKRRDVAIFGHVQGIDHALPGYVIINRLRSGWSWRIPLPGKISVGVVVSPAVLKEFGNSPVEQFDRLLEQEEVLSRFTAGAKRISQVMKYSNYQLISDEFVGENWAAVGDAAGFVDPIFSSGLSLALEGAEMLSEVLISGGGQSALLRYQRRLTQSLAAWQEIAESFYDGRLAGLVRARRLTTDRFPWGWLLPRLEPRFQQVFTGLVSPLSFNFRLARFALAYGPGAEFGRRLQVQ